MKVGRAEVNRCGPQGLLKCGRGPAKCDRASGTGILNDLGKKLKNCWRFFTLSIVIYSFTKHINKLLTKHDCYVNTPQGKTFKLHGWKYLSQQATVSVNFKKGWGVKKRFFWNITIQTITIFGEGALEPLQHQATIIAVHSLKKGHRSTPSSPS